MAKYKFCCSVVKLIMLSLIFSATVGKKNKAGHGGHGRHHGHHRRQGGRVVGGIVAPGPAGHFVYMEKYSPERNIWERGCGGSILTTKVIITACHCITTSGDSDPVSPLNEPRFVRIIAGVTDTRDHSSNRQTIYAFHLEKHPSCNMPWAYDVGVIILESELQFNQKVFPIQVFSRDEQEAMAELQRLKDEGHRCTSGGWGKDTPRGTVSQVLKISRPYLVDNQLCRDMLLSTCEAFPHQCTQNINNMHQTCVQDPDSSNCFGDSGDALICNGYLFGVNSNVDIECGIGKAFGFADISSILYFVNKYV